MYYLTVLEFEMGLPELNHNVHKAVFLKGFKEESVLLLFLAFSF